MTDAATKPAAGAAAPPQPFYPPLPPAPASAGDVAPIEDGRRMRSAESRRRIIQAMLELVQEGNPEPGAEAVATRAGVGLRTVFRLFRDMETICAEMVVPQRQEFVVCFLSPFTERRGAGRVRELYGRLAPVYEARLPFRRAGSVRRYSSPSLAAAIKELHDATNGFLQSQLPATTPADFHRLEMLNLLMSYEAWMHLRDAQSLDFSRTRDTLQSAIDAQLATLYEG
jgi:AcrR family transcriptional regulator